MGWIQGAVMKKGKLKSLATYKEKGASHEYARWEQLPYKIPLRIFFESPSDLYRKTAK